jgi:ABC-2 type transport system permease protein
MRLPFRYMLSLPVELICGRLSLGPALLALAAQWAYAASACARLALVWKRALPRFEAFGG